MKNFLITAAAFSAVLLASCDAGPFPGYEEAENGTYFLLHTKGTGTTTVDTGGAVFVKIKFKSEDDSVFMDINAQTGAASYPMRVDKSEFKGDFLDMFMRLHVGDSASFFIRLDSLKKYYEQEFKFEDKYAKYDTMQYLGFTVKVDSIYDRKKVQEIRSQAEAAQKKQQEMMMSMQAEEGKKIEKYVADNKITAKPSPTGVYYIETSKGKGEEIKAGQTVLVKYTGKFLTGEVFDSSEKHGGEPMPIVMGQHGVIPGMEEGLMLMKKGGKATLIIPSDQAYRDGGGQFPPFATLIFEVEIVDVKATMAPPAHP